MGTKNFEERWAGLNREVAQKMALWRNAHPKATLRQIEAAMDEQLAQMRARMIEDLINTSAAGYWSSAPEAHPPKCPQCGQPLEKHGKHQRRLKTEGGEQLELAREYGVCPACGAGLFPPR